MSYVMDFEYTFLDYPDNNSEALLVRHSGCELNCKECQNVHIQDHSVGIYYSSDSLLNLINKIMKENDIKKLVLSGGDPLSKMNLEGTKFLLNHLDCDVCVYTGNNVEFCKKNDVKGFTYLKCGVFDKNKLQKSFKDDNLMSLASSNQEFYDCNYNLLSEDGIIEIKGN